MEVMEPGHSTFLHCSITDNDYFIQQLMIFFFNTKDKLLSDFPPLLQETENRYMKSVIQHLTQLTG